MVRDIIFQPDARSLCKELELARFFGGGRISFIDERIFDESENRLGGFISHCFEADGLKSLP